MTSQNNPTSTVEIISKMGWLALADPSGLAIWLVLGLSAIVVLRREFS